MTHEIAQFLAQPVVAVVGVSRTRGFGSTALAALRRSGRQAYPVNEAADEIAAVALAREHGIALVHGECVVMYARPPGSTGCTGGSTSGGTAPR
jgi:hypothetical protein